MSDSYKTIVNPHDSGLQIIVNTDDKADKNHSHQISEIVSLKDILNVLQGYSNLNKSKKGYFL